MSSHEKQQEPLKERCRKSIEDSSAKPMDPLQRIPEENATSVPHYTMPWYK